MLKYAHICIYPLYARSKIDFISVLSIFINTNHYFTLLKKYEYMLVFRFPNSTSLHLIIIQGRSQVFIGGGASWGQYKVIKKISQNF